MIPRNVAYCSFELLLVNHDLLFDHVDRNLLVLVLIEVWEGQLGISLALVVLVARV